MLFGTSPLCQDHHDSSEAIVLCNMRTSHRQSQGKTIHGIVLLQGAAKSIDEELMLSPII